MKLLHTVVILTVSVLNRVVAQNAVCSTGQQPFILGTRSPAISNGGRNFYLNLEWRKTLGGNKVKVKALKDTDTMEGGYKVGWQTVPNTQKVIGIGSAQKNLGNYDDDSDGLIQGKEGIEIKFAKYIVTDVTVGVHLLNQGETLRWKAILDGNIVWEGTISGDQTEASDPEGKVEFDISVDGGFEKLVFGVDNGFPDSDYFLEFIEGCYYENSAPVMGPVCTGPTGRVLGDPHIRTFDGVRYDCQGRGEFIVAQSQRFNVQGRFVLGDNQKRSVTVTKGIVFETPGAPKIQAIVPKSSDAQTCDYTFFVNDIERDIKNLGTDSSEITAVFSERSVLFYHASTGARIEISVQHSRVNGCFMALQVCLPDNEANVVGLLGKPDGQQNNDWTMPNGTEANIPSGDGRRFEPAFNYCTTWCAGEQQSKFLYTVDKSYTDYNFDCPGPYDDTLEQDMSAIPPEIDEVCDEQIDDEKVSCLIDGVIGGTQDANSFIDMEEELDELKDQPPQTGIEERLETAGVSASISGDPHIRTWGGDNYDFHGECDLILLKNPNFKEGLEMDIQARSKKYNQWAYISSAVLRIGEDTLEVSGRIDEHGASFWINGVAADSYDISKVAKEEENILLPYTISGHPISFTWVSERHREFEVDLGKSQRIVIKTWNNFVRVDLVGAKASDFGSSLGLIGKFPNGIKMARDGKTIITDSNEFGMEWQVLATEPVLFHNMEGPQAPEKCAMPMATDMRRRLRASIISHEDAKEACSRVTLNDLDFCIFDVMATNDIEIAEVYKK